MKTPKLTHLVLAAMLSAQTFGQTFAMVAPQQRTTLRTTPRKTHVITPERKTTAQTKNIKNATTYFFALKRFYVKYPNIAKAGAISAAVLSGIGCLCLAEKYLSKKSFALLTFGLGATAVTGIALRKELHKFYMLITGKIETKSTAPERGTNSGSPDDVQNNGLRQQNDSTIVNNASNGATQANPTSSNDSPRRPRGRNRSRNPRTSRSDAQLNNPTPVFNQYGTFNVPAYNPEASAPNTPFVMDAIGSITEERYNDNGDRIDENGNVITPRRFTYQNGRKVYS